MKFISEFIEQIFSVYSVKNSTESIDELKATFYANNYKHTSKDILESKYNFLQYGDKLHISITFGDSDPVILNSNKIDFCEFIDKLNNEANYLNDEEILIVVTIIKTNTNTQYTIYDLDSFVKTINNYDINQFFQTFSTLFKLRQSTNFNVFDLKHPFHTSSLSFRPLTDDTIYIDQLNREEIFESFKSQCHFENIENFHLTPDDFKLIKKDENQTLFNQLLDKYTNLLSIIYLFDITSITNNFIEYKINGYKSIKDKSESTFLHHKKYDVYYQIYNWVYNGGNLNDKIGLARNIISLHFKNTHKLTLQGDPFQSVKSSFKVYEKQNIKQYIEIRNKISDQLIDFYNRANKIVETFANGFQKSTLALISFYISAIVIRILSKGEFINIFSLNATILSLAFLGGSLIYFWVSRWEIKEQKRRFISSYKNLKERYTDLLEPDDIEKIMNNDSEYNQDIIFIDKKIKIYSRMWIAVVILLASSTLFLYGTYNLSKLSDTFIVKVLLGNACNCN